MSTLLRACMLSGVVSLLGCASTPTPNFEAERNHLFARDDVLCFIALSPNLQTQYPEAHRETVALVAKRGTLCTPEMAQSGAQAVLAQTEREARVTAMQGQERQQSAGRIADAIARGLAGFATGYAAGNALAPPRPVICNTYQYTRNQATTTCQ